MSDAITTSTWFDFAAGPGKVSSPAPGESPALWFVDSVRRADAAVPAGSTMLDAEELRRATLFHREADRVAYVAAHVALRVLLGAYLGLAPHCVQLVREACPLCGRAHGRPAVAGNEVYFSLSHSKGLALVAVAAQPVGTDVEKMPSVATAEHIAAALHPREAAEIRVLPENEQPAACARVWVRKEAYLKGLGTGLGRDPALDYLGTASAPASLPGWRVTDLVAPPGFAAAVAAPEEELADPPAPTALFAHPDPPGAHRPETLANE
ncbi:hypothetical protein GCM10027569_31040 [Flindersiella endophytica]